MSLGLTFLGVLLLFGSIFMMLLILVQRGKGGGLTGALGGMGGASAFGTKAGDVFTKVTVITSIIWITLCMITIAAFNPPPRPTKTADSETSMSSTDTGEADADADAAAKGDAKGDAKDNADAAKGEEGQGPDSTDGADTTDAATDEGSANTEAAANTDEGSTSTDESNSLEVGEEESAPGEPGAESTESGDGDK